MKLLNIELVHHCLYNRFLCSSYDPQSLLVFLFHFVVSLSPERHTLELVIQMLQRLPIALVQVQAVNNSQNLLNEIRQFVYSLYQSKEITKKVYNKIIKSL